MKLMVPTNIYPSDCPNGNMEMELAAEDYNAALGSTQRWRNKSIAGQNKNK